MELRALGHDWEGGVGSYGVITFACRREGCGETRTEAVQATPTPSPSPVPTPTATPEQHVHNFQLVSDTATCAADGVKTYQCSCGEQMTEPSPATGSHSWQLTGHTDPQVGADGSNVYTCPVCGQTMTETLPALPAPDPEPEPAPYWCEHCQEEREDRLCPVCGQVGLLMEEHLRNLERAEQTQSSSAAQEDGVQPEESAGFHFPW